MSVKAIFKPAMMRLFDDIHMQLHYFHPKVTFGAYVIAVGLFPAQLLPPLYTLSLLPSSTILSLLSSPPPSPRPHYFRVVSRPHLSMMAWRCVSTTWSAWPRQRTLSLMRGRLSLLIHGETLTPFLRYGEHRGMHVETCIHRHNFNFV